MKSQNFRIRNKAMNGQSVKKVNDSPAAQRDKPSQVLNNDRSRQKTTQSENQGSQSVRSVTVPQRPRSRQRTMEYEFVKCVILGFMRNTGMTLV